MRRIACFMTAVACVACSYDVAEFSDGHQGERTQGSLVVTVEHERLTTKALTDYTDELADEKKINDVSVFVFDRSTGKLNAYEKLDAMQTDCTFSLTTGEKLVYAVVNGPDMSSVTSLKHLKEITDDLSVTDMGGDGLVMVGSQECVVEAGKTAAPVVVVRRLVARVVLQKVTNNVPAQYGNMTIDCVFLGNAGYRQTLAGSVSGIANPDGYADVAKGMPIGKNGVTGMCEGYMYQAVGAEVVAGGVNSQKYHLYCQPSVPETVTCLYLLVTIGASQYYYRVPLQNGLLANRTYSVDLEIVNLGADLPPDEDIQKGEIKATVSVSGWEAGDDYVVEF